jgi:MFS family permease
VRASTGRLAVLIAGSSLASAGWGAVLPFLYSDIATARRLGATVAAMTFTAFALGSLLAAPIAGRLADRRNPVKIAAVSRLLIATAIAGLALAESAATVWLAAAALGAAVALSQPAIQVILLAWTPEERHRQVFAWQFIAINLGLAIGGFIGGFVIDFSTPTSTRPIYVIAGIGALLSGLLVYLAGRRAPVTAVSVSKVDAGHGWRAITGSRAIRWLLAVTVLLDLACYAQYESGLPAYVLNTLTVSPKLLGTAVAVNAILVAALTGPVIALTRHQRPNVLLAACAAIWIGCWLVLALPMLFTGAAPVAVLTGYAAFSMGETMLAPILSPLAAELAPEGAVGRTLSAVTGATTVASAIGPAVSGVLMALHLPVGFIALQLACCLAAIGAASRLGRLMPTPAMVTTRSGRSGDDDGAGRAASLAGDADVYPTSSLYPATS